MEPTDRSPTGRIVGPDTELAVCFEHQGSAVVTRADGGVDGQ
ncbi:hypothetical protein [Halosimplex salinum]|nr:hypothetical protein [Halosimplex salinum]